MGANLDRRTVAAFDREWAAFDQFHLDEAERHRRFYEYFGDFPLNQLAAAEGFDLGCGSGRWSRILAGKVGHLHCIDPAPKALAVARAAVDTGRASFHVADAETMPLADDSQDFGVCLGVLHHVPNPSAALIATARKLKPGAPMLLYLYYDLEGRPGWFRAIWKASDLARRFVSGLPVPLRRAICEAIAAWVYFPLARGALLLERLGADVSAIPLSHYRGWSYYSMRTDALDRFGTPVEHRFSRAAIQTMMETAGLIDIHFAKGPPFWVAWGRKDARRGEL